MRTLIVYVSKHKGNTEKLAMNMADALDADLMRLHDCTLKDTEGYDMIGFGSGVYGGSPDKELLEFISRINGGGRKSFAFTTSASGKEKYTRQLMHALDESGFEVLGSFTTRGYITWGPFKLIGGAQKGRPNMEDLEEAREFVEGFIETE